MQGLEFQYFMVFLFRVEYPTSYLCQQGFKQQMETRRDLTGVAEKTQTDA